MLVDRTRHCSDPELLAYLDGELSWWRRIRVRKHLQACWKCRSRAHAQEEQIIHLTQRIEAWDYPGAFWHLDQQLELGRRLRRFERLNELQGSDGFLFRQQIIAIGALAVAAMVACLVVTIPPPRSRRAGSVLPAVAVASAEDFERRLYQRPVEQTLAVQVDYVMPAREAQVSHVEIWSDAAAGSFASRWTAEDGSLKEALWRPAPGREYVLRPLTSHSVLKRTDHRATSDRITDFLGAEVFDDLEGAFTRWMESRSWTPVSFSPEAAKWMSGSDAMARTETLTGQDGSRYIRITVEKLQSRGRARLILDFDAATFQPHSMSIRWEAAGRVAELQILAKSVRSVSRPEMEAAVTPPEVRLQPAPKRVESMPEPPLPPSLPENAVSSDFADRAADAQFVLHAAGACLGEAVLVEDAPGGVRVRSAKATAGRWPQALTSSASLADVLGALADLRNGPRPPATPGNSPVLEGAAMHARALRLLAQRFPRSVSSALPVRSRRLLEVMLQSHIEGVRSALREYDPATAAPSPMEMANGDWRNATSALDETLSNMLDQPVAPAGSFERIDTLLQLLPQAFARETRVAAERGAMSQVRKR